MLCLPERDISVTDFVQPKRSDSHYSYMHANVVEVRRKLLVTCIATTPANPVHLLTKCSQWPASQSALGDDFKVRLPERSSKPIEVQVRDLSEYLSMSQE